MQKIATVVTAVGLLALVTLAGAAAALPFRTEGTGPTAPPTGALWGVYRMGQPIGLRGHLQTSPEAREVWGRLGDLQMMMREKQWELFELQNAEPPAPEAIEAKQAEIREIQQQMQQTNQELAQYRRQEPGQLGEGAQRQQAPRQQWGEPRGELQQMRRMGQPGMGQPGMGQQGMMGHGGMMAPTIVAERGKLYLAEGGQLYMFDAETLELLKVVPYFRPPGPPPFGAAGPPLPQ